MRMYLRCAAAVDRDRRSSASPARKVCVGLTISLMAVSALAQSVAVTKDVPYAAPEPATSKGHLLDLYVPQGASKPLPVVISLRGSGWMAETGRDLADVLANHFNPRGYAVVGVATRSSANAQFPGQLHDIKAAIRWLRANAATYNLDPDRIGVVGDSSGGWTAVMAGTTGNVPALEGTVGVTGLRSDVQAVIAYYPPTDLTQMDAHALRPCGPDNASGAGSGMVCHGDAKSRESLMLGCELRSCAERAKAANPIAYVDRNDPPMLLLHGQADLLVPYNQSELLYSALRSTCNDVTFITYPDAGHFVWQEMLGDPATLRGATVHSTRGCMDVPPAPITPSWETLLGFFDRYLKK